MAVSFADQNAKSYIAWCVPSLAPNHTNHNPPIGRSLKLDQTEFGDQTCNSMSVLIDSAISRESESQKIHQPFDSLAANDSRQHGSSWPARTLTVLRWIPQREAEPTVCLRSSNHVHVVDLGRRTVTSICCSKVLERSQMQDSEYVERSVCTAKDKDFQPDGG